MENKRRLAVSAVLVTFDEMLKLLAMNSDLKLTRYTSDLCQDWNDLISKSRNGNFLFNRSYMDYHADRFTDRSYLIHKKHRLVGVIPGNQEHDVYHTHQGLTFGGIVSTANLSAADTLQVFALLNEDLRNAGFKTVIYKPVPGIYHELSAEEDLYALFRNQATLMARGISSAIVQKQKLSFTESRKSGLRKARHANVQLIESHDFTDFWQILGTILQAKYNVEPVHSLEEITLLHRRFPKNIRLHLVQQTGRVLAGVVMYADRYVAHVQYIGTAEEGRKCGALDFLFDHLINEVYTEYPIFDFGISTQEGGLILNEALIFQKEGFGGRGIVYDCYQYSL